MKCDELTEYTNPTYGSAYYDIDEVDAAIAELKAKLTEKDAEIHKLKRSLIVARHEVAKARGKTSSYKSKTKLKESRQCCREMYSDSWKSSSLSR